MRVLYVGSHSILEYDEVRLLASLGHDVFSIGAYTDPANPGDDKRPALREVAYHPELVELCKAQRDKHAGEDVHFTVDHAKADLHPDLIDWADIIIFAAFPEAWIVPQWGRISRKRVIWRTIGQSDPTIEQYLAPYRAKGLEIVRYSPAEKRGYEALGCFAGEDAMIRFAKDPADWTGWTGDDIAIGNVTQDMAGRGEACGYSFWMAATQGLPAKPAGPKSDAMPGGVGSLDYEGLRAYLRSIRAYLYTGTQPASYTLGLIEAMMTGTPVVCAAPDWFGYPPLYEAHEIVRSQYTADDARAIALPRLLDGPEVAQVWSGFMRDRAIELFGIDTIAPQWAAYLGAGVAVAA